MTSNPREIPASFVRLDTRVNEEDSFANVRDMQRARLNHNVLLSRRARKRLFAARVGDVSSDFIYNPEGGELFNVFLNVPIILTPYTQAVRVIMRAANDGNDQRVYFSVDAEGASVLSGVWFATVTDTSVARYSVDIGLRAEVMAAQRARLIGVVDGGMGGSDLKSPEAVTDVGENWIATTTGGTSVGDIIYFPSHLDVSPRRIVRIAAGNVSYVESPWNIRPEIGWNAAFRSSRSVRFETLCAYELGPSSFDELAAEV